MSETENTAARHVWRFFRAGGFDHVRIESGNDVAAIGELDQKLWVALACPTRGIAFDERTLDLIDTDHDGRIRVPDIVAAAAWTTGLLADQEGLAKGRDSLPLAAINDQSDEGKELKASASTILRLLGKTTATEISLQDAADVERIFNATPFNGDGVIADDAAEDEETRSVLIDIMSCLGSVPDRSGKPGVSQEIVDRFFAEAAAYTAWAGEADAATEIIRPLGPDTETAATLARTLAPKLDDYFTRCRLASFDPEGAAALNPPPSVYDGLTTQVIDVERPEIHALPLAHVGHDATLAFGFGINPAFAEAIDRFRHEVLTPLIGAEERLSESGWHAIQARLAPFEAWRSRQPETALASLGIARIKGLIDPAVKARIDGLLARDKALEAETNAIARVEKLLRFQRDLLTLLNNTVSFRDFYSRTTPALFQAGRLYLDGRSCDLCVAVTDDAKHAQLAALSRIYLVYCLCSRQDTPGGTAERMTIAAGITAGDADNFSVGRNGVFYDRKGRDWDATIIRIIEHPISLRQAFWLPYRQAARFIGDQVQKFAAARSAATQTQFAVATVRAQTQALPATAEAVAPARPAAYDAARFAGVFAAVGLAIGVLGTAIASIVTGFLRLTWWQMPLAILGILVVISGPSILIAAMKLKHRNLGPILDACGWAVNTRLRINIPFGTVLTALAKLPEKAERSLRDPYAERRHLWPLYLLLVIILAALATGWRFGFFGRLLMR